MKGMRLLLHHIMEEIMRYESISRTIQRLKSIPAKHCRGLHCTDLRRQYSYDNDNDNDLDATVLASDWLLNHSEVHEPERLIHLNLTAVDGKLV